jgi:HAD superfamily hydrolase (TIGR01509 family)
MDCRLVIFDCDGVLIDSEPIVNRVHAKLLARCGFAIEEAELLLRFCGISDRDMLATIAAERGRALPADYGRRAAAMLAREYRRSLRPIVGVAAALERLPMPARVASSGEPKQVRRGLEAAGLARYFAGCMFSAAEVARGKPAPDLFVYAAARMGVPAARCLVVEDSVPGIRAAVAAGMAAIGFTGGAHCRPGHDSRLLAAGAALAIDRMADLLPAIAQAARPERNCGRRV